MGCQSLRTQKSISNSASTKFSTNNSKEEMRSNPLSRQSLFEELTGQKIVAQTAPAKILQFAREARYDKNYALAIKRYNILIKKYPKSKEIQAVYYDKSSMYTEMGLHEQARYNLRLAQNFKPSSSLAKQVKKLQKQTAQNLKSNRLRVQSANTRADEQKVSR